MQTGRTARRWDSPLTNGLNLNPAALFCIFPISGVGEGDAGERDPEEGPASPSEPVRSLHGVFSQDE